jgi:uncharacterized protein YbcC (UPF0753/DUF2309 family)
MDPELKKIIDDMNGERLADILETCIKVRDRIRKTKLYRDISNTESITDLTTTLRRSYYDIEDHDELWAHTIYRAMDRDDPERAITLLRTNLVIYIVAQEHQQLYVNDDKVRLLLVFAHFLAVAQCAEKLND